MIGTCTNCRKPKRILQSFYTLDYKKKKYLWLCLDCNMDGWIKISTGEMRRLHYCSEEEISRHLYYNKQTHRFNKLN